MLHGIFEIQFLVTFAMKLGFSSEFVRRTVHNQTQPLQLFALGTLIALVVVCVLVFGIAYEADSLVITEHELETANATAMNLEKKNHILQRRLKAYDDKARRELAMADDLIKHLNGRLQQCDKLLTKCSKIEEEEDKELEAEKTAEQKLEKKSEDLTLMMNLQEHEIMNLENQTKQANATMMNLMKQLQEEQTLFKKASEHQIMVNGELDSRLSSQKDELIAEVAGKEFGKLLLEILLFLCLMIALGLGVVVYGRRTHAPWLPTFVTKFLDPPTGLEQG